AAQKLVGTLAHPLNRPIVSHGPQTKVVRGYSILQPRVSIHLNESQKTRYLQVHAVNPGIDPYASAASDVYQDLFRDGSFTGKGIYDLHAFDSTLEQTFPENQILSHDLIEGCHARVALVSDIEVFDGYPGRYDVDARRMHRWVRDDWQISPWLLSRVPSAGGARKNTLSALSRWKIVDNLRRSLVPVFVMLLLICGWLVQPAAAWLWSGFAATIVFAPALVQLVSGWMNWTLRKDFKPQFSVYLKSVLKVSEQCLYSAMFLPHKALQMCDAIVRTCYRMLISRRLLLEWETAAASESRLKAGFWSIARRLSITSLVAVITGLIIAPESRMAASPWLFGWLVAPAVGQLISTPRLNKERKKLVTDAAWIRELSSATWAFFEHHVNAAGNWLPPDNLQEYPGLKVATRISPTNEGLFLVSSMVARRFGFTGLEVLIDLLEKNRQAWNTLEQLKGHHFNWYETTEPRALPPKYISTVDSGNLLACYLTVTQAIADIGRRPVVSQEQAIGARTSIAWLQRRVAFEQTRNGETTGEDPGDTNPLNLLEQSLRAIHSTMPAEVVTFADIQRLVTRLNEASARLSEWSGQVERQTDPSPNFGSDGLATLSIQTELVTRRFQGICKDVRDLMPWLAKAVELESKLQSHGTRDKTLLDLVSPSISLRELSQFHNLLSVHEAVRQTLAPEFFEQLQQSSNTAQLLWKRFSDFAAACEQSASEIDFTFLYNQRRKLFSIGYNVDTGKLDRGHYDMLCSECRIASYLAIAKGDVETEHWFRLGRQATELNGSYALLSWGGTMFEFLMPQIFQRTYEDSLIQVSCMTAIDQQVRYGQQRGVPWGISESAMSVMAKNLDYQYKSFGVPGLGLKRGLSKDLVVSPYSTALSLPFAPQRAVANLKRLAETALGPWGFYDAIDFTPSRLARKQTQIVVRNYMAHHQAMSILSFANALYDDVVVNWFHAHPLARANELLLQEKIPAIVEGNVPNPDEVASVERLHDDAPLVSRRVTGVRVSSPSAMLMSNGSFTSMLTH
ncbi:MAG TPA: glucoamylase family protein, partial [Planctomycetaceae bacterium]|nr:glucoamylase family protein [Planctomycetaceae bacterium]